MSDATQGGLLFLAALLVYFVPTTIAFLRHHNNRVPIAVLNFFLGWTVLGWIAVLAWSFTSTARLDPAGQARLPHARRDWQHRDQRP